MSFSIECLGLEIEIKKDWWAIIDSIWRLIAVIFILYACQTTININIPKELQYTEKYFPLFLICQFFALGLFIWWSKSLVKYTIKGGRMSEISDFLKEMDRVDKWWNKKGEELARQKHEKNRGIKYD